jgi:Tfp pilus assembly protein FimT
MTPAPERRWFAFTLWALFLAVPLLMLVVLVVSERKFIRERQESAHWLEENGGIATTRSRAIEQGFGAYCPDKEITWWRRLLGDETAGIIQMGPHATKEEKKRMSRVFGEADVLDAPQGSP